MQLFGDFLLSGAAIVGQTASTLGLDMFNKFFLGATPM